MASGGGGGCPILTQMGFGGPNGRGPGLSFDSLNGIQILGYPCNTRTSGAPALDVVERWPPSSPEVVGRLVVADP